MIVYGKNVISQLENDPAAVEELYVSSTLKDRKFRQEAEKLNVPVLEVPRSRLDKLTTAPHTTVWLPESGIFPPIHWKSC